MSGLAIAGDVHPVNYGSQVYFEVIIGMKLGFEYTLDSGFLKIDLSLDETKKP